MAAAALVALLYGRTRERLTDLANQLCTANGSRPTNRVRTFASRMTRAVPMDELLQQLSESLRKTMQLAAAEVYTGSGGTYDLAAGVPHTAREPLVLVRPGVLGRRPGRHLGRHLARRLAEAALARCRPLAAARRTDRARRRAARPDRAGTPARQRAAVATTTTGSSPSSPGRSALALHNVQLDSALQRIAGGAATDERRAAAVTPAHRQRRRPGAAQARTQPARRRPAVPRGDGGQAAPRGGADRGRPGRGHGRDHRPPRAT